MNRDLIEPLRTAPRSVRVEAMAAFDASLTTVVALMDDQESIQRHFKPEAKPSDVFLYYLDEVSRREVDRRRDPRLGPCVNALCAVFRASVQAQTGT